MFVVDTTWKHKKDELLGYFRSRIAESLDEIQKIQGTHKYREQATAVNRAIAGIRTTLISALSQTATREGWYKEDILECVLMVSYVSYVVMIETRNEVWPYDYMSFSRRVGEFWELFCKLCFEIPQSDAVLFIPPLFSEVRQKLTEEPFRSLLSMVVESSHASTSNVSIILHKVSAISRLHGQNARYSTWNASTGTLCWRRSIY